MERLDDGKPSEYVKILQGLLPISLYILYELSDETQTRQAIRDYALSWQKIKPFADGSTLRQHQILPGPVYRDILEKLREAWLDGHIHTREEEDRLLEDLVQELQVTEGKNAH